jgi:hypothetical protein
MSKEEITIVNKLRVLSTLQSRDDPTTGGKLSRMFPDILPDKEVAASWWKEITKNSVERANRTDDEWAQEYGQDRALPEFDSPLTKDEQAHAFRTFLPYIAEICKVRASMGPGLVFNLLYTDC